MPSLPRVPLCLSLILLAMSTAQALSERALRVEGAIAADGASVTLQWWQDDPHGPDPVTVSRRQLGATGAASWTPLASVPGGVNSFTDTTTSPGVAYEYQVHRAFRSAPDPVEEAAGYWCAGRELPATDSRGILLLVVDQTHADALAPELRRLESELTGDG